MRHLRRVARSPKAAERGNVALTGELRLAEVQRTAQDTFLDVEVRPSDLLPDRLDGWAGAEVRLGIHWLGPRGVMLALNGPRSEPLDLEVARWTPVRRLIRVGPRPPGASELQVELVAEGVAWGSAAGLAPLRFAAPLDPVPVPALPRSHGPEAPEEPPSQTRSWLAAGWPRDAGPEEMAIYVGADLARFLISVQLLPDPPGRVLEIGSNPYFISRLIRRRFPSVDLSMTNYFGDDAREITQDVVDADGRVLDTFHSQLVETETEPLPYPDESFDTVLLCEVIEHLIRDPVFQLTQIARVLRPGGTFILTTPNVARAVNRRRLSQRQGIYDPYSRFGPHGRHNREYTADELFELVRGVGFEIESYLTRPVHAVPDPGPEWFRATDDDGAGDYHFLRLRRAERLPAEPLRPAWLYR
ncbi:MAG: class I SAM-dependent methyltransferase [Thermoleophilia bacterium]